VDDVIPPHFEAKKTALGLPPSQCSIWAIDCWSVYRSKEYLDWMKQNHPIILLFVPSSLYRPLDIGIQGLFFSQASAHWDIVDGP
ncbi:hypothetical protein B0H19DRAFT_943111, partial [Mycena capillaripes]